MEYYSDYCYLRSNTKVSNLMDITCTNCDNSELLAQLETLNQTMQYLQTVLTIMLELVSFGIGLLLISTISQVVVIWARRF
jgi:hypothetical protein